MRGILLVNKRQGWTSFDVVNFCKRVFGTREVGHLGTLDPMATGVLAVTVGSATKLFDMFLNKTKTYVAEFTFGYTTDTLDAEGQIEDRCDIIPTLEQIKDVLPNFQGTIEQMPPKYSAKKIGGKKAYDLAREGKDFELKPSKVTIHNLKILDYKNSVLKLEIECGAGTYIRSLGRDIATSLNTLATMTSLVRTKLGGWSIENCIDIKDNTNEFIQSKLLPIDSVFNNLSTLDNVKMVTRLLNGQTVIADLTDGDYRLYKDNEFVAIATSKDKHIKMTKYFRCDAHTK
ncbi:MAG: tRNA pseudouridine(55) synthase TruB [Clostridia bacterium]|nr:tRNA pseudouridine(55) synthase TruB [Clostridia bacterium]